MSGSASVSPKRISERTRVHYIFAAVVALVVLGLLAQSHLEWANGSVTNPQTGVSLRSENSGKGHDLNEADIGKVPIHQLIKGLAQNMDELTMPKTGKFEVRHSVEDLNENHESVEKLRREALKFEGQLTDNSRANGHIDSAEKAAKSRSDNGNDSVPKIVVVKNGDSVVNGNANDHNGANAETDSGSQQQLEEHSSDNAKRQPVEELSEKQREENDSSKKSQEISEKSAKTQTAAKSKQAKANRKVESTKPMEKYRKFRLRGSLPPPLPPLKEWRDASLSEAQRVSRMNAFWNSAEKLLPPAANANGRVYVMNAVIVTPPPYIPTGVSQTSANAFAANEQTGAEPYLSVFLLTKEYLRKSHGLHAWPRRGGSTPPVYKQLPETIIENYKTANPPFYCVFLLKSTFKSENVSSDSEWLRRGSDAPLRGGDSLLYSLASFVPNNTTRDRYVNDGTEVVRCALPFVVDVLMGASGSLQSLASEFVAKYLSDDGHFATVLLTQDLDSLRTAQHNAASDRVHVKLRLNVAQGSAMKLLSRDRPLVWFTRDFANGSRNDGFALRKPLSRRRRLGLCMPPMSEPLPFVAENVAQHLHLGVEHVYVGTHFGEATREQMLGALLLRLQPWVSGGEVTVWSHAQRWLQFSDKAKAHWLNQCLYYAKTRDEFVLSLDADEFVLVHAFERALHSAALSSAIAFGDFPKEHAISQFVDSFSDLSELRKRLPTAALTDLVYSRASKHEYCWLAFGSFQVWKLWDANGTLMATRWIGREQLSQYTWSKVVWNSDALYYTGYHAGGGCVANARDWNQPVDDWRSHKDAANVWRFADGGQKDGGLQTAEGRVWHFYNSRFTRIEPMDEKKRDVWSQLRNDSSLKAYYVPFIAHSLKQKNLPHSYDYPAMDAYAKYDAMKGDYYKLHYGENQNMAHWKP